MLGYNSILYNLRSKRSVKNQAWINESRNNEKTFQEIHVMSSFADEVRRIIYLPV
jgi:hypothetical protein